jgi:prepilin-type N-terminal cleavage/methylation domain-containing protein
MNMMNARRIQPGNKQQGFTIIELVVVILLLGILTATALPRFMNLSTEAHNGVISGVEGSFRSGLALYRATWTARGQPAPATIVAETLRASPALQNGDPNAIFSRTTSSGYPFGGTLDVSGTGTFTPNSQITAANCNQVISNLMDVSNLEFTAGAATFDDSSLTAFTTKIDTALAASPNTDFFAYPVRMQVTTGLSLGGVTLGTTEVGACVYVYAGERGNVQRSLVYVPYTGNLFRVNSYTDLAALVQPPV